MRFATWVLRTKTNVQAPSLPRIDQTDDRRMGRIWTVDIAQNHRARLDDAVDDGGIEGEVEDVERLVEVRQGGPPVRGHAVTHVDPELLKLVEDVGQLLRRSQGSAR